MSEKNKEKVEDPKVFNVVGVNAIFGR